MPGNLEAWEPPVQDYTKRGVGLEANKFVKFFIHGLLFTLIMYVIIIGWIFLLIPFAMCGFCFGIAIALGILAYVIGWINSWLMERIWGREKEEFDWWGPLIHGILLFVVILVLSIPWYAVTAVFPEVNTWPYLIISILVFFVYCLIDGFAAYYVGAMFTEKFARVRPPMEPPVPTPYLPANEPKGPSPPNP